MRWVLVTVLVSLFVGCTPTPPIQSRAAKIYIERPGLHKVTGADLARVGIDLARDRAALERLELTRAGAAIPRWVEFQGEDWAVMFYAPPPDNPYSPYDVYYLSVGETPGTPWSTRRVSPHSTETTATAARRTLELEQERIYQSQAIGGEHWFWQSLSAPSTRVITATLTALDSSRGELEVRLGGLTTGAHVVEVKLNDEPMGAAKGNGQELFTFLSSPSNLRNGENLITLRAPGGSGSADVVLLDSVVITYSRKLAAENNQLEWSGGAHAYRAEGFQSKPEWLLDVTNPLAPQRLEGFTTEQTSSTYAVEFQDQQGGERTWLAQAGELQKPARIAPVEPNTLRDTERQADYVVIAPQSFHAALGPLIEHRSKQGLKTALIDIDQVYDVFSFGVPDPRAIRAFLDYARAEWAQPAPRWVLLVGKASYDYRNYLNAPNQNLVPTYLVMTPHLGKAASDDWYVPSDDNGSAPALAVGRIPAQTPDQVRIAVEKILRYEAAQDKGPWLSRAVYVADGKESLYEPMAEEAAELLPDSIAVDRIYLSEFEGQLDAARERLVQAWNEGARLMTYIGHGSIDTWAAGPLFSSKDAAALRNQTRLPLLLTPTCLDGFFYHPEKDSLTEELLFHPNGGIIAGIVPTGLSQPSDQQALMIPLMEELGAARTQTLGEILVRAKRAMNAQTEGEREVSQTFVLIGDPTLRWSLE